MCEFKSAIMTKHGDVLHSPWTDSHEDLVAMHKLRDGSTHRLFVRLEYVPTQKLDDLDAYELRLDEREAPDWFDDAKREKATKILREVVERMIVREGEHEMLIGGQYIVCGDSKVKVAKNCRIQGIFDSAQVESICGSAQVESICGSAQVESIFGSAQVKRIFGSAQVKRICGSAQVESICGSAQVKRIFDSAQVVNDNRIISKAKV